MSLFSCKQWRVAAAAVAAAAADALQPGGAA